MLAQLNLLLCVQFQKLNPPVPLCAIGKSVINWLKCSSLAWILQFYPHFYQNHTLITQTKFPPTSTVHLDPHSEEYYQKLVEALELGTQAYSHVSPEILTQFKALIRKYPMAFHLPGAELRPVNIGIFCEKQQEKWEQFLQPAVYAHNVSPISGTSNISPFFLVFGRHATSPETISLQLPVHPLPPDRYTKHLIARLQSAHKDFTAIKANTNTKIFMTRKLVSFYFQMVRWFMFKKNHHHIYQAVQHVL